MSDRFVGWWAPIAAALTLFVSGCQAAGEAGPRLEVIEGDEAINNIRLGAAREPVVQALDENGRPLAGVAVTFTLPEMGPGASFADGSKTLVVTTDEAGRAVGRGLRPNSTAGPFEIRVSASYQGRMATARFRQTNVLPAEPAPPAAKKGGSAKWIAILAVAVGGGVGAAMAAGGGGGGGGTVTSPAPPPSTPSTVLVVGGSTFGPP